MKVNIGPYPTKDKERKVSVTIDNYDVWNLDHTLALIIHPALLLLEETKAGYPIVLDRPEGLEENTKESKKWYKECQKAWNVILKKMIWSFNECVNDFPGKEKCFKKTGIDMEQYNEYYAKVQEGFDLFGKHFQSLWT
jgi:hypothetical protein